MDEFRCEDCRWWSQVNDWHRKNHRGLCRRYAPRPIENLTDDWPGTDAADCCGEFEWPVKNAPARAEGS